MTPTWYNSFLGNFWKENGFSKTMIQAQGFSFNNADLKKTKQNPKQNLQEAGTVFQSHCNTTEQSERSVSSDGNGGLMD